MINPERKRSTDTEGLPDDIIHEILVRVPTASLLKCRAVCKSWNSCIKTPAFIRNHLKSNNKNDELLLVYSVSMGKPTYNSKYFRLDFIGKDGYTKGRVSPIDDFRLAVTSIHESYQFMFSNGTCNGLICMQLSGELGKEGPLHVLWNPCVRKFLTLPRPSITSNVEVYKLGYDSVNNDYKLVQTVIERGSCIFHVLSLLSGSWKNLNPPADFVPTYERVRKSVFVNGALHWISCTPYKLDILTFNLSSEVFGKFKVPEAVRKTLLLNSFHCVNYRGCFALRCNGSRTQGLKVWVMKEYGSAESWTELTIRQLDWFVYCPEERPRCFTMSGKVFHGTMDNGVVSTEHEVDQAKVKLGETRLIYSMDTFVESLALLDRSDACSY